MAGVRRFEKRGQGVNNRNLGEWELTRDIIRDYQSGPSGSYGHEFKSKQSIWWYIPSRHTLLLKVRGKVQRVTGDEVGFGFGRGTWLKEQRQKD